MPPGAASDIIALRGKAPALTAPIPTQGGANMPDHETPRPAGRLSRPSFDEAAAALGLAGPDAHLDELYRQLPGVLSATAALRDFDVADAEPDLAFIPAGPPIPPP